MNMFEEEFFNRFFKDLLIDPEKEIRKHLRELTLKSTYHEKVLLVYESLLKRYEMPRISTIKKCNQRSEMYRNQGNNIYKNNNDKNNMKVLEYYNRSIAFADPKQNNNKSLALGFGNRSAFLFNMGFYKECLVDIEYAIQEGFPEELIGKLKNRSKLAKKKLNLSKKFVKSCDIPQLSFEAHLTIENAANCIEIKQSSKYGHHIVATRDIKPGQTIAVEKCFASQLIGEHFYTHCDYCSQRSLNLIPCESCHITMYCDGDCLNAAMNEYHSFECPILEMVTENMNESWIIIIRTVIKARNMFPKLVANKYNLNRFVNEKNKKLYKSNYGAIHNLTDNRNKKPITELLSSIEDSAKILYMLENDTNFFDAFGGLKPHQIKTATAELLLLHSQTFVFNSEDILEARHFRDLLSYETIGFGLSAIRGLLNHACIPNAMALASRNISVLTSLSNIKKGEQIFISYGKRFDFNYFKTFFIPRRELLAELYCFECECKACIEAWPVVRDLPAIRSSILLNIQEIRRQFVSNQNIDSRIPWLLKKIQENEYDFSREYAELYVLLKLYFVCKLTCYNMN